jgi:hypothetical protein
VLEHERTLFMFYGYRMTDGTMGGGYFKLANSLAEALADLHANDGVDTDRELGYLVRDAFVESSEEEGTTMHVELISLREVMDRAEKEESDG